MATLSITIDDSIIQNRIVPAYTQFLQQFSTSQFQGPATGADIKAELVRHIKQIVAQYEHQQSVNSIPPSADFTAV